MENIIAIFEYNHNKYIIKYIEEKKVGFFKMDAFSNFDNKLTLGERKLFNFIYKLLQVSLEKSVFYGTKKIENRDYNLYYDSDTHNFFWNAINKTYYSDDNIKLNFKYNHDPNVVYSIGNVETSLNKNNMFHKIIKIGKKYIFVFVSATMVLSSLTACSVADNPIVKSSEMIVEMPLERIDKSDLEKDNPSAEKVQETPEEYHYDDIRSIIESNNNLTKEEKAFLNKLQIVFDEYHEYMDLKTIKERLQTLDIEYQKELEETFNGKYLVCENKIIITNATCFEEAKLTVLLHEFLHVLQSGSYKYFTNELSNEFFTKEIIFQLYKEGILRGEEFLNITEKYIRQEKQIGRSEGVQVTVTKKTASENELLKEVLGQNNFVSGYMYHMSVYYILAEILPKEVLCSYQFHPEQIEILKDEIKKWNGLFDEEDVKRMHKLIDSINDLRDIDLEKNQYVYSYPDEQLFCELDYFYQKIKGRSIKEDFLVSLRMTNYEILSNFHFEIYDDKYYEEIIANLTSFLKEEKGLDYLSYTTLIDKTILSNSQENATIMGFSSDGQGVSIVIDDELQKEYVSYLENMDSLNHFNKK